MEDILDLPDQMKPRGNHFQVLSQTREALFDFTWKAYTNPIRGNQWQTVDVVFDVIPTAHAAFDHTWLSQTHHNDWQFPISLSPLATEFLSECLRVCLNSSPGSGSRVAKLIVPLLKGQIVRSDIVPLRFIDCEFVDARLSLSEPLKTFSGRPIQDSQLDDLAKLLGDSAGGLILQGLPPGIGSLDCRSFSQFVEAETENRLSFPWISSPAATKTLVIVEGSRQHPSEGGTGPNIYLAAIALGIKMVVLDVPGHWLEGTEYEHWREAFIPIEMSQPPDEGFSDRIAQAVATYEGQVDGIITFCDSFQHQVALAAQKLGLPTSNPEALRTATNKYATSVFEGRQSHLVSSTQEVLQVAASQGNSLFPCIIKPCNGWSSEGVFLINNNTELIEAVGPLDALSKSKHGSKFVIERYCAGPEVDANFVLLDGEILFFEVCDDFPKSADTNGSSLGGGAKTFIELDSVFPSKLPESEINLLRICFHNTLLRLGLRDGIMHLEGRVDNSTVEYRTEGGLLDLRSRAVDTQSRGADKSPSAWLIEVNPRPPGMKGTQVIESTHGVDYWGLGMLIALRDGERTRALCHAFKHGPQYTCVMVFIPADYDLSLAEGLFDSGDICDELFCRRPDLAKNVSRYGCLVRRGQKVTHPSHGVNSFLAYFNVFSRKGREDALRLAKIVREEVRFSFK
ncbi:hypothetical protein CORC01_13115 [Colletotrichum orchidophilum]|uniref:ATP-grasp domain-containing protein n=1 Tax=Colletotrichum orchidophilum TaxID=1209926 RepID=A0A1G4AQW5_9PEZI|nr:uncharacterized protein CORC01_13115 [Colletotrichum orchidophilum]OHE91567.1 hypothetical protein CORC01_13115 [Colletotrichum orchidophilum]